MGLCDLETTNVFLDLVLKAMVSRRCVRRKLGDSEGMHLPYMPS
jgi:hypothetical protein